MFVMVKTGRREAKNSPALLLDFKERKFCVLQVYSRGCLIEFETLPMTYEAGVLCHIGTRDVLPQLDLVRSPTSRKDLCMCMEDQRKC